MLGKKVKWYRIFSNRQELEDLMVGHSSKVYRNAFVGELLLIHANGEYYAFKNKCPHQNKPLDGCSVNEGFVVCPFHRFGFSIEDGKGNGLVLDKYQLEIGTDGVFIGIEKWSLF